MKKLMDPIISRISQAKNNKAIVNGQVILKIFAGNKPKHLAFVRSVVKKSQVFSKLKLFLAS